MTGLNAGDQELQLTELMIKSLLNTGHLTKEIQRYSTSMTTCVLCDWLQGWDQAIVV